MFSSVPCSVPRREVRDAFIRSTEYVALPIAYVLWYYWRFVKHTIRVCAPLLSLHLYSVRGLERCSVLRTEYRVRSKCVHMLGICTEYLGSDAPFIGLLSLLPQAESIAWQLGVFKQEVLYCTCVLACVSKYVVVLRILPEQPQHE